MPYRNSTVLVVDNGLFLHMAQTLAGLFGRVMYYSPWEYPFPKSNQTMIGAGISGIERVSSIWSVINDVDLFVFTDVNFGPLQVFLENMGKRVWGPRLGEVLEVDRAQSKELCIAQGIEIGPYDVVTGLEALREYLIYHDNVYVKVSRTRGDCESFYARDYKLIEPRLDELEWSLGAKKFVMEFVVEEAIEDAVEIGYDGFTIDGLYARNAMWGVEIKDKGVLLEATTYNKLPWQLQDVQDKLSPIFKRFGYRGFFSSEVDCTPAGNAFLMDPCCRMPSPPGELMAEIVTNWDEIIWHGAEGQVIEPKFAGRYGAELMIESEWAARNWQPIDFPDAIADFVKLRNATMIEGRYYIAPQPDLNTCVGAVVAFADTLTAAIKKVTSYAEQIQGYNLHTSPECLDEAVAKFEGLQRMNRRAA